MKERHNNQSEIFYNLFKGLWKFPAQTNPHLKEQGNPRTEDNVSQLLEAKGLFRAYTPEGKDPTCFPIQVMDELQYDIAMKAYRESHDKAQAGKLARWKQSIGKLQMAYEIIVYPTLELAESRFASNPVRDPGEHGPASYESAINEAIRDAQEYLDKDIQEYPHRAPVELNDEELGILGRITQARGLPFNPEKRVYRYTEHLARLDAKNEAAMRRFGAIARANAIDAGILRERGEIEEEIRQRQEKWQSGSTPEEPPPSKPSKP